MGELEAIRRRHLLEVAEENCAGSYSFDPEGWFRPQGHDLDLAVEDVGKLLAEVERLRGVVEAAKKVHALHVKRDQMVENDTWESEKAVPVWKRLENAERKLASALAALELKP